MVSQTKPQQIVNGIKQLFLPEDSLSNRISYYHLLLLMIFLPFDQFFTHLVFIAFALHTLLHVKKADFKRLFTLGNLLLQGVFFSVLLSISYSAYPATALADVTRLLLILLFPVFFSLNSLNIRRYLERLLFVFTVTCMATIAYLYLHAVIIIRHFGLPLNTITSSYFLNQNFSNPINMHATFFSLQVALAFFYLFSQLFKPLNLNYRLFYIAGGLLLFAGLVQLGSKAVLITTVLAVVLAVPFFLLSGFRRFKYFMVSGALSILFIAGLFTVGSLKDRYVTGLKTDLSDPVTYESVEPRITRWNAVLELVAKKPVIGYGAGSELSILGNQFFNKKLYIAYLNRFNAHNQYLSFLLITGAIGLLVYLFTLAAGYKIAICQKNLLFFIFLLLITLVSLSESLLNAEKGVFFYSLFFSLFVFSAREQQAADDEK